LVIENLSFVIQQDDSENFSKNAQLLWIALQRVFCGWASLHPGDFAMRAFLICD
jgi:hypothetical protein